MKKTAGKETPSKASAPKEAPREKPKAAAAAPAKAATATSEEAATPKARMSKPELKFFEALLNEKKETLIQELGYLEDNTMRLSSKEGAGDLSSHAYHLADHATETQDREQAFHMASREGKPAPSLEELTWANGIQREATAGKQPSEDDMAKFRDISARQALHVRDLVARQPEPSASPSLDDLRWAVELNATNVLDKRYETAIGYDAPRRGVMLKVTFEAF